MALIWSLQAEETSCCWCGQLTLNAECAAAEKAGKPITPPGLPLPPAEHAAYITEDCIPAPKL